MEKSVQASLEFGNEMNRKGKIAALLQIQIYIQQQINELESQE